MSDEQTEAMMKHVDAIINEVYTNPTFRDCPKCGHLRFIEAKTLRVFPGEGKVLGRRRIPLTMQMIEDALREKPPVKK